MKQHGCVRAANGSLFLQLIKEDNGRTSMNEKIPWYKTWLCKTIGHKFTPMELVIFQIKNNAVNVARHGYSPITCPRCKEVFDPNPNKEEYCEKSNGS